MPAVRIPDSTGGSAQNQFDSIASPGMRSHFHHHLAPQFLVDYPAQTTLPRPSAVTSTKAFSGARAGARLSPSGFTKLTPDLSQHGIGPGFLGHVADKILLGIADHASAALASAFALLESQNHALPAGSYYDADVPLLAGLDFFVRVLVDVEVQTVECGDCRTPHHLRRRGKKPLLGTFLSSRFIFRIFAAPERRRFRFNGKGNIGRGR